MIRQVLLPLLFAFRNLRNGIGGFGIFLASIALGVATLSGISALSRSLTDGLAHEGSLILGGDIALSRMHRPIDDADMRALSDLGQTTTLVSLRAMARTESDAALIDVKAIEPAYPITGAVALVPPMPLSEALSENAGRFGIAVDGTLLARLGITVGQDLAIGQAKFRITSEIADETDRIGGGLTFGPRVLLSRAGLETTGLVTPESLVRYTTRVALKDPETTPDQLAVIADSLTKSLSEKGFEIRTRLNASPQLTRNIERFSEFLAIIGLVALIVGGTGVGNTIHAYIDRRRISFAILKALGAQGRLVFASAFAEVMGLAFLGTCIGLVIGNTLPFLIAFFAASVLPVPLEPKLHADIIAIGAIYGLLLAAAFAIAPLGKSHDIPVTALFRELVTPDHRPTRFIYRLASVVTGAVFIGAILLLAHDLKLAAFMLAGISGALGLLRLVAAAMMSLARRLPHPPGVEPRLALANIHRPGSLTPALVQALGLGVSLLVTIGLVEANLTAQLTRGLPNRAPSFFFVDIPGSGLHAFRAFLADEAPGGTIVTVPMLRGRITALNGIASEQVKASDDAAWVLDGDRGITYASLLPEGSRLVAGQWWDEAYSGPPLVSVEADIAKGLGLRIGDTISVNVLGRTLTAHIANLRAVDWQSLGINFVMVFSPSSFKGAPVAHLATVTLPDKGDPIREAEILAHSAKAFPAITAIRVREALETLSDLIGKLALAIRGASGVTVLATILVLAGALGAGQRNRLRDAVILKTLGATRRRLLLAYAFEFLAIGSIASLFGLVTGTVAAFAIVTFALKSPFVVSPWPVFGVTFFAVASTLVLGLVGTWRILSERPSAYLKSQ